MTFLQVALIVEEAGGSVLDAQGELITTQYFDSLAAEVNDMLQVRAQYACLSCQWWADTADMHGRCSCVLP